MPRAMMRTPTLARLRALAFATTLAVSAVASVGCIQAPSKVAHGQLYSAVKEPYASYFHDVHDAQVAAASWGDDKKAAHKSLVQALELTPDSPDVTIVQVTHERASRYAPRQGALRLELTGPDPRIAGAGSGEGTALFHAVEEGTKSELERAKKMHAEEPKLEALAKTGHELEGHVDEDYAKWGSQKLGEVKGELKASFDAIDALVAQARREARESEDFVADLQRAIETASVDHAARASAGPAAKPAPAPPAKSDHPRGDRPASTPPASRPPGDAPPPAKPAPKPADTGEVFTP
jgi:hypothetical protein